MKPILRKWYRIYPRNVKDEIPYYARQESQVCKEYSQTIKRRVFGIHWKNKEYVCRAGVDITRGWRTTRRNTGELIPKVIIVYNKSLVKKRFRVILPPYKRKYFILSQLKMTKRQKQELIRKLHEAKSKIIQRMVDRSSDEELKFLDIDIPEFVME